MTRAELRTTLSTGIYSQERILGTNVVLQDFEAAEKILARDAGLCALIEELAKLAVHPGPDGYLDPGLAKRVAEALK